MAILNSSGILLVSSIPTHAPTSSQSKLARLEDSLTMFYYNGTGWLTIRLDAPESYTGNIIADNATLGQALQSLESAIEAITLDGNHTPIVRATATEDVEPTSAEVPTPIKGDTADISLTNAKVEKWVYGVSSWTKAFTLDYTDVTDLTYNQGTSSGEIEVSNGNNAILPAVTGVFAGLMLPAHKAKLDHITVTQPVNLDELEATLATAIKTVSSTPSITLTKTATDIKADLKLSATQIGAVVTLETDGLRVRVIEESKPTGYLSKEAATTALGADQKFRYLAANLDGATESSVAWT
jgi:hypothetical protein